MLQYQISNGPHWRSFFIHKHDSLMSSHELDRFLEFIQHDKNMLRQLNEASSLNDAANIATDAGFEVNWVDWLRYQAKISSQLSDEEAVEYCNKISNNCERYAHGTFIPIFGYRPKAGGFSWVKPFGPHQTRK